LREHFVETSHGLWRLNLRISVISEYCHTPKRREKGAGDVGAHGERGEGRKDKAVSHGIRKNPRSGFRMKNGDFR